MELSGISHRRWITMFTSRYPCGCHTKVYRVDNKQVSSVRDLCDRHCAMELEGLVCDHVLLDYMANKTGIPLDKLEQILEWDSYNAELLHFGKGRVCKERVDKFDVSILRDVWEELDKN